MKARYLPFNLTFEQTSRPDGLNVDVEATYYDRVLLPVTHFDEDELELVFKEVTGPNELWPSGLKKCIYRHPESQRFFFAYDKEVIREQDVYFWNALPPGAAIDSSSSRHMIDYTVQNVANVIGWQTDVPHHCNEAEGKLLISNRDKALDKFKRQLSLVALFQHKRLTEIQAPAIQLDKNSTHTTIDLVIRNKRADGKVFQDESERPLSALQAFKKELKATYSNYREPEWRIEIYAPEALDMRPKSRSRELRFV